MIRDTIAVTAFVLLFYVAMLFGFEATWPSM